MRGARVELHGLGLAMSWGMRGDGLMREAQLSRVDECAARRVLEGVLCMLLRAQKCRSGSVLLHGGVSSGGKSVLRRKGSLGMPRIVVERGFYS